ncbi:hypothetical protein RRG08_039380 [Elysia crispata]|uniref:C2H2-type domain-containing protein n=1 Tax=Elysia crispata TaxID=231223 RepID=A0AAE0XVK7_9GAST|nr:hypothetical protein RRG08_039380 [Elysia crispata]
MSDNCDTDSLGKRRSISNQAPGSSYSMHSKLDRQNNREGRHFKCSYCFTTWTNKIELQNHISRNHGDSLPYVCSLCGKGYRTAQGLALHIHVHEGRSFPCPLCANGYERDQPQEYYARTLKYNEDPRKSVGASFSTPSDKTRAIWQPGKIKVQPSSDLAFSSTLLETSPPSLDQNVVVESQFKQHLCRICGRSFVTRGGLSHHMKVHGTKRFQCPICFSKFFHKHHMRDHSRVLHDGGNELTRAGPTGRCMSVVTCTPLFSNFTGTDLYITCDNFFTDLNLAEALVKDKHIIWHNLPLDICSLMRITEFQRRGWKSPRIAFDQRLVNCTYPAACGKQTISPVSDTINLKPKPFNTSASSKES